MKNEVLDILILGLLVVLFASIYRKRATARLRCWVAGWLLVLLHFAAALFSAQSPRNQALLDSGSICALLLAGLCFLLSSSPICRRASAWALVACGIGLPAVFFISYVVCNGARQWPLYAALSIISVSGVLLARHTSERTRVWAILNATYLGTGLCAAFFVARHQAEQGIAALLFQTFLTFAALYWFDFRRISTGVLTSILGLIAWASVFPVATLCAYLLPAGHIPPELWNIPKFFVAFGMIVTLLEDEFLAAALATEHYRLLFAAHPHPMWVQDPETLRILEVNDAAVAHYGYEREEFVCMTLQDLRPTEDAQAILEQNRATLATKLSGPWAHRRKDGSYIQVDTASHSIDYRGRRCSFVLVQDVTDRQQLHELLVHQAHHDLLTGLPNRLLLEDRMQRSLAQAARHGQQAAVLCLDLDGFKEINDTFGHAAGDLCLQQVVARISARLRAVDTFARTGGDEFVIILGELSNKHNALMVARSVLESIAKPFEGEAFCVDLSASIGIAMYPDDGSDAAHLRRSADAAMYRAKQAGGDQYLLASTQPGSTASEIYELESFLRGALHAVEPTVSLALQPGVPSGAKHGANSGNDWTGSLGQHANGGLPGSLAGGLEIRYQPQYSMAGHLCGLEASLRLNHPQLGSIAAERFLPVAEECGLIVPLGNWLLDQLCSQSLQWQRQQLTPPRISFAISPLQFLHSDFAARVQSTVTEHGLDPRMIELIVTESTVMRNRPEVAFQMRSLAALGVHFSVADFGTSYSCLSHLHQLPVSTLKIDCSFIERISDPNGTYTIVQAIIALAHGLGLKVVAEGVERADQMECLRTLHCDFLQGQLLAPALTVEGIARYLVPAATAVRVAR